MEGRVLTAEFGLEVVSGSAGAGEHVTALDGSRCYRRSMQKFVAALFVGSLSVAGCDEEDSCTPESSELIPEQDLALVDADAAEFVDWFVGDHAVLLTPEGVDSEERVGGVLRVERLEDAPELWTSSCGESINVHYEVVLEVPAEEGAMTIVPSHRIWLPASWQFWSPTRPDEPSFGEVERLDALLHAVDLPSPESHYIDVELSLPSFDGARCSGRLRAKARRGSSQEDQPFVQFRCLD